MTLLDRLRDGIRGHAYPAQRAGLRSSLMARSPRRGAVGRAPSRRQQGADADKDE